MFLGTYNIEALDTAKQAMMGMDDLLSMLELKKRWIFS